MKKQTISLLLVFVLAGLSGFHGLENSEALVFKTPGEITSESVQQEEEFPGGAGLPVSIISSASFLLTAVEGSAHSVMLSRSAHLTPVFYEGGYLSDFYKYG